MQGKKKNPPKLFYNFSLEEYVPADNFYRILRDNLDLSFIYKETEKYYGHTGRPSLGPVVFFKCMMVGYLENIRPDRALERMVENELFPHKWRILSRRYVPGHICGNSYF